MTLNAQRVHLYLTTSERALLAALFGTVDLTVDTSAPLTAVRVKSGDNDNDDDDNDDDDDDGDGDGDTKDKEEEEDAAANDISRQQNNK